MAGVAVLGGVTLPVMWVFSPTSASSDLLVKSSSSVLTPLTIILVLSVGCFVTALYQFRVSASVVVAVGPHW